MIEPAERDLLERVKQFPDRYMAEYDGIKLGDIVLLKRSRMIGRVIVLDKESPPYGIEIISKKIDGSNLCVIGGEALDNRQGKWRGRNDEKIEVLEKRRLDQFSVGDRVICRSSKDKGGVIGKIGTIIVIDLNTNYLLVMFDVGTFNQGHSGQLPIESNSCWWLRKEDLVLIKPRKKDRDEEIPQQDAPAEAEQEKIEPGTTEDKEFTAFVGFIMQVPEQYIYVARDKDGKLFAYIDKPIVDVGGTQYYGKLFKKIKDDLFPKLKFTDGALKIREVKDNG